MIVLINPGSGPVQSATGRHAEANMRAFRRDLMPKHRETGITFGRHGTIDGGRYPFRMKLGKKSCLVDMPGLPLDEVRYMGTPGQNIWHFPRLYIDGSSWVWMYAVNAACEALGLERRL